MIVLLFTTSIHHNLFMPRWFCLYIHSLFMILLMHSLPHSFIRVCHGGCGWRAHALLLLHPPCTSPELFLSCKLEEMHFFAFPRCRRRIRNKRMFLSYFNKCSKQYWSLITWKRLYIYKKTHSV